jgi:hypothetical protein
LFQDYRKTTKKVLIVLEGVTKQPERLARLHLNEAVGVHVIVCNEAILVTKTRSCKGITPSCVLAHAKNSNDLRVSPFSACVFTKLIGRTM